MAHEHGNVTVLEIIKNSHWPKEKTAFSSFGPPRKRSDPLLSLAIILEGRNSQLVLKVAGIRTMVILNADVIRNTQL